MQHKLTQKQAEMMAFIDLCCQHPDSGCMYSFGGAYIETGDCKPFKGVTLRSLLRKGLVRYKDGGTKYRSGVGFHIIIKS